MVLIFCCLYCRKAGVDIVKVIYLLLYISLLKLSALLASVAVIATATLVDSVAQFFKLMLNYQLKLIRQ